MYLITMSNGYFIGLFELMSSLRDLPYYQQEDWTSKVEILAVACILYAIVITSMQPFGVQFSTAMCISKSKRILHLKPWLHVFGPMFSCFLMSQEIMLLLNGSLPSSEDVINPLSFRLDEFVSRPGLALLVGGIGVVLLPNPIFSEFYLGFVLVYISLLYILENSYFVASAQLLIYVEAINVILFTVMFMNNSEYSIDLNMWNVGNEITSPVCTTIIFSLIAMIFDRSWYMVIWTIRLNQILEQNLISNSNK
ncbi:unnamed protein product [Brassica oleracea]